MLLRIVRTLEQFSLQLPSLLSHIDVIELDWQTKNFPRLFFRQTCMLNGPDIISRMTSLSKIAYTNHESMPKINCKCWREFKHNLSGEIYLSYYRHDDQHEQFAQSTRMSLYCNLPKKTKKHKTIKAIINNVSTRSARLKSCPRCV
jgi:hypothetical protein